MAEKPTGVTANKTKREFTVTWDSGHTSVYPFGLLRAACPCAQYLFSELPLQTP